jgi:uncharacterized SAM-dependent methyltransferase
VRKVKPLLDRLEAMQITIHYFALDLSKAVLDECMKELKPRYRFVRCFGLWGTFDDALAWSKGVAGPKCFMCLGSMLGNDHFEAAVEHLREWADSMGPQDRMLLGLDACQDEGEIWRSYHDSQGMFERFIRNGLVYSNTILGHPWYRGEDWEVTGAIQDEPTMHKFIIRAVGNVSCAPLGLRFAAGDEIHCYEGFKYGPDAMHLQFVKAGLQELEIWRSPSGRICGFPHLRFLRSNCSLSGLPG